MTVSLIVLCRCRAQTKDFDSQQTHICGQAALKAGDNLVGELYEVPNSDRNRIAAPTAATTRYQRDGLGDVRGDKFLRGAPAEHPPDDPGVSVDGLDRQVLGDHGLLNGLKRQRAEVRRRNVVRGGEAADCQADVVRLLRRLSIFSDVVALRPFAVSVGQLRDGGDLFLGRRASVALQ